MGEIRKIRKVLKSKPTIEGAGVHLQRVFGFSEAPEFDPFLLLDDFRSEEPQDYYQGFPWHPHRGIETITYMLAGEVDHADSLGNQGVINPGEVQWMTAGSGIIHQEMPRGDADGRMGGFQLWANLPAAYKMMPPRYRDVRNSDIPEIVSEGGARVRVICGRAGDVQGPVQDVIIDPQYLDVRISADSQFTWDTPRGHTVFAYIIEGQGVFCHEREPFSYPLQGVNYFDMQREELPGNGTLVSFEDGDQVVVSTQEDALRFLLISGKPIREPVAWYGPIVMNTQAELRQAFDEIQKGTFIKSGSQPV